MNKTKLMLAGAVVALMGLFSGCDKPNEALLIAGANTAGNIALSAWFAIDDPGCEVKDSLKGVVTVVGEGAKGVAEGESYVNALYPAVQNMIAAHASLTDAQKNLANVGAGVVLSGLDSYIGSNDSLKGNVELVSKVVSAFCKGCVTALAMSDTCRNAKVLKSASYIMKAKYSPSAKAFMISNPIIPSQGK